MVESSIGIDLNKVSFTLRATKTIWTLRWLFLSSRRVLGWQGGEHALLVTWESRTYQGACYWRSAEASECWQEDTLAFGDAKVGYSYVGLLSDGVAGNEIKAMADMVTDPSAKTVSIRPLWKVRTHLKEMWMWWQTLYLDAAEAAHEKRTKTRCACCHGSMMTG